jgi:hypothetical protein
MENPADNEKPEETPKLLDPTLINLTPRHSAVYRDYQIVRVVVAFCAAACFVTGSVFFLFPGSTTVSAGLFLAGSILFAVKPTIDLVRSFHLRRIPVEQKD